MPPPSSTTPDGSGASGDGAAGAVGPAVLDHVAVAVERWADAWPRYAVELGGAWGSGGLNVGFGPAQLRFANGARLEILQPWQVEANPFLRRFLDTNGPGPHHLTFKVADLTRALEVVTERGYAPVGVDLSDPMWKEAFLHPRQATGIVVQLAEAAGDWTGPAPEGFPASRLEPPASLDHVTHAVADLQDALVLFGEVLGGAVRHEGGAGDVRWVDLVWSGPLTLRLLGPASPGATPPVGAGGDVPLLDHLAGRPGRLHHLRFSLDDPPAVTGAASAQGAAAADTLGIDAAPAWVVPPVGNLGTRLVLVHP